MTWQERRIVTILSAIVALLALALLIVLGIRHRENLALREQEALETVAPVVDETVEETRYVALTYYNGATTLSFTRSETGHWLWSDDMDFPLDESTVLSILHELDAWAPQQTLKDEESLKKALPSTPTATLTATTNEGTVATLSFGQTTDDEASYYVCLNGDEATAYIISDALYKLMCVPIYDMCVLPEFPELPERILNAILLNGALDPETHQATQINTITAQHAEGDPASVTWRCSGVNISNHKLFRELLADLEQLAFSRCIIYRPSDEAASICGFDAPDATVGVSYTVDGEIQHLRLIIGKRLPDESGRYVRLNDDPSIYLLETALLDPMMHLAVVGMEND